MENKIKRNPYYMIPIKIIDYIFSEVQFALINITPFILLVLIMTVHSQHSEVELSSRFLFLVKLSMFSFIYVILKKRLLRVLINLYNKGE